LNILSKPKRNSGEPFIIRYTINKQRYIQILKWKEHQKPHPSEADSKIPPPPKSLSSSTINTNIHIDTNTSSIHIDPNIQHIDTNKTHILRLTKNISGDSYPIATRQLPDSSNKDPVPKPKTDVQKVVLAYKLMKGFDKEDKGWDDLNFARCSKPAKQLLKFFGNYQDAILSIQDIGEYFDKKDIPWGLEAICKNAAEWKQSNSKEGGRFNG